MARRKTIEERLAERLATMPPPEEGKTFEHGPAKFVFVFLIVFIVLLHVVGLAVVMHFDLA